MFAFVKSIWEKYKFNSLFFKTNFIFVSVILVIIFVFYGIMFYIINKNNNDELAKVTYNDLTVLQNNIENTFDSVTLIANKLSSDQNIKFAVSGINTNIFDVLDKSVTEKINEYRVMNYYIDSIYVFSDDEKVIYSNEGKKPVNMFDDMGWYDDYKDSDDESMIIFRKKCDNFPNVATIIRRIRGISNNSTIVLNVNLNMLSRKNLINDTIEQYVVNDDNKIVCTLDDNLYFCDIDDLINEGSFESKQNFNKGSIVFTKQSEVYGFKYVEKKSVVPNASYSIIAFILTLAVIFVVVIISISLSVKFYKPFYDLADMSDRKIIEMDINSSRTTGDTVMMAKRMLKMLNETDETKEKLFKQFEKAERFKNLSLQLQINSHFIFNTLNVISLSVSSEYGRKAKAVKDINNLSKFIRYIIDTENNIVSVEDEISCVLVYLEILKTRNDSLVVEWSIPEEMYKIKIPKMSLQPLIENAFFYGNMSDSDNVVIKISAGEDNGKIYLDVHDNGKGMSEKKIAEVYERINKDDVFYSKHIGLKNVHQRAKIMYGDDYGIRIFSEENKWTTIRLLIRENENDEKDDF